MGGHWWVGVGRGGGSRQSCKSTGRRRCGTHTGWGAPCQRLRWACLPRERSGAESPWVPPLWGGGAGRHPRLSVRDIENSTGTGRTHASADPRWGAQWSGCCLSTWCTWTTQTPPPWPASQGTTTALPTPQANSPSPSNAHPTTKHPPNPHCAAPMPCHPPNPHCAAPMPSNNAYLIDPFSSNRFVADVLVAAPLCKTSS